MALLDAAAHLARSILRRDVADAETQEELAFHLEQQTRKYMAAGASRADAERLARIDLGGLERWRDATDRARPARYLRDLRADARFALRGLFARPAFSLAALATLAIGIGACATVFAIVDGTLLEPLPIPDAARVMSIVLRMPVAERNTSIDMTWSYPKYQIFRREQHEFSALALHSSEAMVVGNSDGAERLPGEMAGAEYFRILGARPQRGRVFTADEDSVGGRSVVILSDRLWRTRYGAGPMLGRTLLLNGVPRTVVGVMQPGFAGLAGDALYWVPTPGARSADALRGENNHNMELVGRLKDGVSVATARASAQAIGARINTAFPRDNGTWSAAAYTFDEIRVSPTMRRTFVLLGLAVVLLLGIVCVNLTTLLMTRRAARQLEFSVRAALGAERSRLVRQLVAESGMLAVIGLAIGTVIATFATRMLVRTLPLSMPTTSAVSDLSGLTFPAIGLTWHTVVACVVLTAVIALVIGLASARRLSDRGLFLQLRSGRASASSRGSFRLAAAQIALALVFLFASGMTIESLRRTLAIPLGFDANGLLTLKLTLDPVRAAHESQAAMWDAIVREVGAVPGVKTVAIGSCMPIGMHCDGTTVRPTGHAAASRVMYFEATPNYFDAIKTPLVRGRLFEQRDMADTADIAIINEAAARTIWGPDDALTTPNFDEGERTRIIGVVADARYGDVERPAEPAIFMRFHRTRGVLFVRTASDPMSLASAVRSAIRRAGAGHATADFRAMSDRLAEATARPRLTAQLFSAFALSALLLAALGVYGTLALQVAQRSREFAIRRALGAPVTTIARIIGSRALVIVGAGLILGGLGAIAVGRTLSALLYDVSGFEPMPFAGSLGVLVAVAAFAAAIPAWRSVRIDPRDAMMAE